MFLETYVYNNVAQYHADNNNLLLKHVLAVVQNQILLVIYQLSVEYMDKYYQMKIEMILALILNSIKLVKYMQVMMQLVIPKMIIE